MIKMINRPFWLAYYFALLKLRHSYWFHFAHKPLCQAFQTDVIHLGHCYVCRSCSCVYLGFAIALTLFILCNNVLDLVLIPYLLIISLFTLINSLPTIYRYYSRPFRDILRCSLGISLALLVMAWFSGHYLIALSVGLILWLGRTYYLKQRLANKQQACDRCPELMQDSICSGFSQQAESIRVYEQQATDYLVGIQNQTKLN